MIAASAPVWKTLRVCPADPLALAHPQANLSQSQGCRGEVSEESQHLIGDGFSDWMTEEVDFSSYLPNPPSPPNASLPPSPLHNDNQVPSDLEVMTSLLQEELAQLEDYFLSEPLPEKGPKFGKCDKAAATAAAAVGPPPQPCCHPSPYAPGAPSNPLDSASLPVTLATGEVDLLSICGGPVVGRSKIPRHAPYGCGRPSGCARKRVADAGARLAEEFDDGLWTSKGDNSGSSSATFNGNYGFAEEEQVVERGYCLGNAVELRFPVPPREEKSYCLVQEIQSSAKAVDDDAAAAAAGFTCDAPIHVSHKKEDLLAYGGRREVGAGAAELLSNIKTAREATKAGLSWKTAGVGGGCYLPPALLPSEDYQSFLTSISEQVKSEGLQADQQDLRCGFAEDQGSDYLLMTREGLGPESPDHHHTHDCSSLTDDHCAVKYELDLHLPFEGGERKQKKRDQNKTAAHRYRQRKRAELSTLEEQLQGLEGRNRELRDKAESVEREIQYVKDLLIEVYKARSQRVKQDATA
ncbi:unnamed protein product [Merluccius merluccius]